MIKLCTTTLQSGYYLGKKNGAAYFWYLKNGNTQQCNIFRNNKYNFRLVVCEISTPYVKCNESYELEKNDGSNEA